MSLARKHKQRVLAAQQAADTAAAGEPEAKGSEHYQMLTQLTAHSMELKGIKSVKAKIEKKVEFLSEYTDYVDGVIASDSGLQDQVLMTVLVWELDIGFFPGALEIAEYALRHDLKLPERFSRDLPTLLVEEIAEYVLAEDDPDEERRQWLLDQMTEAQRLTEDSDMPDEVRAKLFKARGLLIEPSDPDAAITYLKIALELDRGCGVITKLKKLEKDAAKRRSELVEAK